MVDRGLLTLGFIALLSLPGCRSGFKVPPAWNLGGQTAAYHKGPLVAAGETGPRRFVMPLLQGLGKELDGELVEFGWRELPSSEQGRRWILEGQGLKGQQTVVLRAQSGGIAAATLLEGARCYGAALVSKSIPRPSRSLVVCLAQPETAFVPLPGEHHVLAELELLDPISEPCSLMHTPDPGGDSSLAPATGLNLVMRLALVDVGMVCRPWKSRELPHVNPAPELEMSALNPPVIRLAIGDSGVDLARTDQPGVSEAQRAGLAIWVGAGALAGARGTDLDRYLSSILLEARLRHYESEQAGEADQAWQDWLRDARLWVRAVVLGLPV
ncbi:MAG: hypothetical protein ACI89E_001059 [Planctomycetota bacterium]